MASPFGDLWVMAGPLLPGHSAGLEALLPSWLTLTRNLGRPQHLTTWSACAGTRETSASSRIDDSRTGGGSHNRYGLSHCHVSNVAIMRNGSLSPASVERTKALIFGERSVEALLKTSLSSSLP